MRYFKVITERERKVGTFYYCNYIPESLVYGIHKDDSLDDIIWQIGLKHPVLNAMRMEERIYIGKFVNRASMIIHLRMKIYERVFY